MASEKVNIDPWSSTQSTDYTRIIEQFGLSNMNNLSLPDPSHLHRRGIVFAHRDLDIVLDAQKTGEKFGVLTGLMPSGRMHLGHSMVIEQVKWFQQMGGDVTIAVADLESQATRGVSLEKGREIALTEYVANYAALGLNPDLTNVYFQSSRSEVQRLGFQLGKRTNLSEFEAIYGFRGETNLAHVQAPMVQVGDILHPQTEDYGGLRPIVVPVGVDQDPHFRITRDVAPKIGKPKPALIHNTMIPALSGPGGKMSASSENETIYTTDSPDVVKKKINKYAFSGGQPDIEEHRKKGGNPDIDVSYQYLRIFFEQDDNKLKKIYNDYKSGSLLTGELKSILIEKINEFLKSHQEKREQAKEQLDKFLLKD